jgi:hypothetical protein
LKVKNRLPAPSGTFSVDGPFKHAEVETIRDLITPEGKPVFVIVESVSPLTGDLGLLSIMLETIGLPVLWRDPVSVSVDRRLSGIPFEIPEQMVERLGEVHSPSFSFWHRTHFRTPG